MHQGSEFAAPVPSLLLHGDPLPSWIDPEWLVKFLGPYDWDKEYEGFSPEAMKIEKPLPCYFPLNRETMA